MGVTNLATPTRGLSADRGYLLDAELIILSASIREDKKNISLILHGNTIRLPVIRLENRFFAGRYLIGELGGLQFFCTDVMA